MSYVDKKEILATFLEYTKINTTAVAASTHLPSCSNQRDLALHVINQLDGKDGITTEILDNAITTITLKPNDIEMPSIVFFAHLDTAADHTGDTKAQIISNYQGGNVALINSNDVIYESELANYTGDDIIITDGTSLLGADDKAAIASAVEAVKFMIATPSFKHGEIKIVLLPDEEIGIRGAKALDVDKLNADFGICLDCCAIGEYVFENWYAGDAKVEFNGATAHPMSAKNKLVNSLVIANEFFNLLPAQERPEHTEDREGYFWCQNLSGDTALTTLNIAIRDFELEGYKSRKLLLQEITSLLQFKYGEDRIKLTLSDTYSNVKEGLDKNPQIISSVQQAMNNLGITPTPLLMRGGYDGSVITPNGLPTINIFTGAHNFHSTKEFLPVSSLKSAADMLIEMTKLSGEK
ncbi:peptidase T [Vibrio sp. SS-MA-C1-2]|uniref:peptidase T n=1 Tax=Vibrio sp. SS-MA-C1-2 TaxID=2908646 RepID=UPI001F49133F|nr:peptidase T [Vibrio sp. SS-MA-C1-2]UJF17806.1 peptidase T [Vibrio sp. SS-MA-C1-2]